MLRISAHERCVYYLCLRGVGNRVCLCQFIVVKLCAFLRTVRVSMCKCCLIRVVMPEVLV